ncbi:hypothetical protein DFP98_14126 [Cohnella phaseoli]|uniref:Uncharacterized protein n=1 Tax=Cohnella phaseoli TaxID=456490 RepID=A0A3D9I2U7_9BACL|nr:hypothetical protein DFP98_14126 [Cohnella phaseoli]
MVGWRDCKQTGWMERVTSLGYKQNELTRYMLISRMRVQIRPIRPPGGLISCIRVQIRPIRPPGGLISRIRVQIRPIRPPGGLISCIRVQIRPIRPPGGLISRNRAMKLSLPEANDLLMQLGWLIGWLIGWPIGWLTGQPLLEAGTVSNFAADFYERYSA